MSVTMTILSLYVSDNDDGLTYLCCTYCDEKRKLRLNNGQESKLYNGNAVMTMVEHARTHTPVPPIDETEVTNEDQS